MYHILRDLGKDVTVFSQDEIPRVYSFLPGIEAVSHTLGPVERFDAVILLDCSELDRVGTEAPRIGSIGYVINIDHHISNQNVSELALIDTDSSSTGELLFRLIEELRCGISKDIAVNLYTAILTDTGAFRYSNTKADTLRLAAALIEKGAEPHIIAQKIYESKPIVQMRLMECALGTLEMDMGGKVGAILLDQNMMKERGAKPEHTEGLVDMVRSIEGVEVAIFYYEMPDHQYKISLRSKGAANVEQVARALGGGGHVNAAACRVAGNIGEIKETLRTLVCLSLKGACEADTGAPADASYWRDS